MSRKKQSGSMRERGEKEGQPSAAKPMSGGGRRGSGVQRGLGWGSRSPHRTPRRGLAALSLGHGTRWCRFSGFAGLFTLSLVTPNPFSTGKHRKWHDMKTCCLPSLPAERTAPAVAWRLSAAAGGVPASAPSARHCPSRRLSAGVGAGAALQAAAMQPACARARAAGACDAAETAQYLPWRSRPTYNAYAMYMTDVMKKNAARTF